MAWLNPGAARDAELLRLETAARTRRLTPAEQDRQAELQFHADKRGHRLRFRAIATVVPPSKRARA